MRQSRALSTPLVTYSDVPFWVDCGLHYMSGFDLRQAQPSFLIRQNRLGKLRRSLFWGLRLLLPALNVLRLT